MSAVRPFAGRLVRAERAQQTVRSLSHSQDESGVDLLGVGYEDSAYGDPAAAVYVYRQAQGGAAYTGLFVDVAVSAIAAGLVRAHEAVDQLRVDALIWHHAKRPGPPMPVKLLQQPGPRLRQVLAEAEAREPLLDFPGPLGFQQTIWRVEEGADELLAELTESTLYIADGHHRTAAALAEWEQGDRPDEAALMCVVYPLDALVLSAFHRRVPGRVDPDALVALAGETYSVLEADAIPEPDIGRLGMYAGGRWFVLTGGPTARGVAGLDVTVLQEAILDRLDPADRKGLPVETIPAARGIDEARSRCDADGGALFTLAPPRPEAVLEVADDGEIMPPKATYFEPKPAAGLFLRG